MCVCVLLRSLFQGSAVHSRGGSAYLCIYISISIYIYLFPPLSMFQGSAVHSRGGSAVTSGVSDRSYATHGTSTVESGSSSSFSEDLSTSSLCAKIYT